MSSDWTMASESFSDTPARLATTAVAPSANLPRTISIRSSSVSSGENCSTGAATASSASRASCLTRSGGASATSFKVSATTLRTRAAVSLASTSSVFMMRWRAASCSPGWRSGRIRWTLPARPARTSTLESPASFMSACQGRAELSASAWRTSDETSSVR